MKTLLFSIILLSFSLSLSYSLQAQKNAKNFVQNSSVSPEAQIDSILAQWDNKIHRELLSP